jgi:hypothetical protein
MPMNQGKLLLPLVRFAAMAATLAAVSACSMGGMMPSGPAPSAQARDVSATAGEMALAANSALPAIATECPPIKVRAGGETLFFYGNGKVGNPSDLNYQAVIENQSRNCVVSNGKITVRMGVVGRLMLGPSGNQKQVNVPLRFAVERDNVALFSEKYEIPVAITPPDQSAEFVKVVENVQIPYLGGEQITIWVGFDGRS